MNWRTWAPLAVALVLGLSALLVARKVIAPAPPQPARGVAVVTIARGIDAGRQIEASDLVVSEMPLASLPRGTFGGIDEVTGRVAVVAMVEGQPVLEALLAPKGAAGGLQALVPPGMRAVTVDVNESTSVGGLLQPGSMVDVVATLPADGGMAQVSRTVVHAARVQAVGQRMGPASGVAKVDLTTETFRTVTLLVTPKQAESIEIASAHGRPRLVLRNPNDRSFEQSSGVTLADLRGGESRRVPAVFTETAVATAVAPKAAAVAAEPTARRVVEFIRGGVVSRVAFESQPAGAVTVTGTDAAPVDGN